MVVLQKVHAILHKVVNVLAQNHLLRHLVPQLQQPFVDLPDRFVRQENAEVRFGDEQPRFHISITKAFDDGLHLDLKVLKLIEVCFFVLSGLDESEHIFGVIGELPADQIIDDDSQRERVALDGVHISFEGFERHVERTAYFITLYNQGPRMRNLLGESKIADLPYTIFEEDISWLEVSMDDILRG